MHLQREGRFSEERSRFYAAELLCALEHLHAFNVRFFFSSSAWPCRHLVIDFRIPSLIGHLQVREEHFVPRGFFVLIAANPDRDLKPENILLVCPTR